MYLLIQFFRDLKRERTRIFLTVLGITWGTASIVLMLSIGEGVKRSLLKGMHGMGKGIVVVWNGETSKPYKGLGVGRKIRMVEEDALLIRKIPEIEGVSPEYKRWGVPLSVDGTSLNIQVAGVHPSYGEMRNLYPETDGRFLNDRDIELKRRVMFIGDSIRVHLFGDREAVGKTIYLNRVPFIVIGVMQKKLQTSMYGGPDYNLAVIPASTFRMMFGHRTISDMVYRPKDEISAKVAKDKVYRSLGEKYQFDPEDTNTLSMWDTLEMGEITEKVLFGVQIFLGIIGGLTLLVAGVGVANIMYVVVRDRTREIGIKIAVGAKRRDIVVQYVLEALLTVFLGGIVGLIFSWSLVKVIAAIPIKNEAVEYLGRPTMSPEIALIVSGILGGIGLLAGYFPARRAASIDPVEALRYE